MSKLAELESKRAALRAKVLGNPDAPSEEQAAITHLRDRIVAAKKKGNTEKVEALIAERTALKEARDAEIIPLNGEIATAKRAARHAARDADRKQCEGFSDTELEGLIAEKSAQLDGVRRSLKALVAERDHRAEQGEVKRLVDSLSELQLASLKAHLAN